MNQQYPIFVAGHNGLVGSAIRRALEGMGYANLILRDRSSLDLSDAHAVRAFFEKERPKYVFLAAAKVGGIQANNQYPADFIRDNLQIQTNVVDAAYRSGVQRLLFLGSSCIYPKLAPQPIREDSLLTGPLEPTNRPYALAKIAGIEMCWSYNRQYGTHYLAVMPTNIFGVGDNYDLSSSHVVPALIRKTWKAKKNGDEFLEVWGSGTPRRELLYSDDLADACVFLMNLPDEKFRSLLEEDRPPLINIGTGQDLTIRELAQAICEVVGFRGELRFDPSRPDGTPRKVLNVDRIHALGWEAKVDLKEGIRRILESDASKF